MVYNGFVVVDTRDNTDTESNYDTPALPAGGGNTPPSNNPSGPLPGLGGQGWNNPPASGSGGGSNWQKWVNPETVGSGVQLLGNVANLVAAGKTPEKSNIKAACGRKPLFNRGGKKDAYQQCVQRMLTPQQPMYNMPIRSGEGLSSTAKVLIGVGIFLFILTIIIVIVMMNKNKVTAK